MNENKKAVLKISYICLSFGSWIAWLYAVITASRNSGWISFNKFNEMIFEFWMIFIIFILMAILSIFQLKDIFKIQKEDLK